MRAFVTATGTDIGKTYVTCGLLRHLIAIGGNPAALKPVMSGYDPATSAHSDAALLLKAQGRLPTEADIATIAPWRFAAPLSPDMAARLEGRQIDYPTLLRFCRTHMQADRRSLLIEGVGGAMVPLDDRHTVLDWMADLGLRVVLVAGSYLGTLSHTLTALAVMQARGLDVGVTVLNETLGCPIDIDQTTATIARHSGVPVVSLRRDVPDDAAFARIARLTAGLPD